MKIYKVEIFKSSLPSTSYQETSRMNLILNLVSIALLISISSANNHHPFGHSVPFQLDENSDEISISTFDKLKDLFAHPEVENRKVVILSIIGAYRKGKSFFLDYCLRFLYANYRSVSTLHNTFIKRQNWWGEDDEPLLGFSWKHGSKSDTKGILFWSDVFLHDQYGEKIAIFLIDTQGLFESGRDGSLDAKIFGITNLISSIQIFNIKDVIQEDQLEHLKTVIDFSKLTTNRQNEKSMSISNKPFQNLLFLLRDWHDEDFDFGYGGGHDYLKTILNIEQQPVKSNRKKNDTVQSVRDNIKDSYDNISAFLLPTPGAKVQKRIFDGRWSLLDDEFKENFKSLIESIFLPQNLIKKKMFGKEVTSREFLSHAITIFTAFKNSELPDYHSLFEQAVKVQLMEISDKIIDEYMSKTLSSVDNESQNFTLKLITDHNRFKTEAIDNFRKQPKMADPVSENNYIKVLEKRIDEKFSIHKISAEKTHKEYIENKIRMEEINRRQQEEYNRHLQHERQQYEERIRQINHKKSAKYIWCKIGTLGIHRCGL